MTAANIYWDCYQGHRLAGSQTQDGQPAAVFEEIEHRYYEEHYTGYCEGQNGRNDKARHSERNKTPLDLFKGKRTQPEESILQIGNIDATVDASILLRAMEQYQKWFEENYGEHVHIIDWALHMDETTPHIHERHVFDYTNKYGELQPMQEQALAEMGIERPEPDQPKSRTNNRKATFDHICRAKWMIICQQLGVEVETEPIAGRRHMQKDDFIIENQDRRIAERTAQLDHLELQVSDLDGMIRDITNEVYEQVTAEVSSAAAEVAAGAVLEEIERYEAAITDPKGGAFRKSEAAVHRILNGFKNQIRKVVNHLAQRILRHLHRPETQSAVKAAAGQRARESVLRQLEHGRKVSRQRYAERMAAQRDYTGLAVRESSQDAQKGGC